MLDINTKVHWRTGGRGVFRIVKGTIIGIVKAGKLPLKTMRDQIPHGDKPSNRDRYVVEVKDGVFAWANVATTRPQTERLPAHKPRLRQSETRAKVKKATKPKAKNPPKVKTVVKADDRMAQVETPKRKGGDKPKQTWYALIDGKVVSVRKVVCPEGFSKDKPEAPAATAAPAPAPAEPVAAAASDALPQASV